MSTRIYLSFFSLLFVATTLAADRHSEIRLEQQPNALIVQVRREGSGDWLPIATYVMEKSRRPYLHPVKDPSGKVTLTDNKPADHPWQHGIFTGFHRVNGFNYWKEDEGKQRFVKLIDINQDKQKVSWTALIELVDPAGTVVLEEENKITFHAPESSDNYKIDFDLRLRAKDKDVTFGKFFVGGLSVRMPWNQAKPQQTHLNSEGVQGRAGEQKRAKWCTVEQPMDGHISGFAILDHPANRNHPSGWRVDEQGLINPNISMIEDWSIPAGQEQFFRYRILVYNGHATQDKVELEWKNFAAIR